MFSLLYPEAMFLVHDLAIGLIPVWLKDDPIPKIIVKASKESILAAKMRHGFAIYLIPYAIDEVRSHGFLAAFFDNEDEPLTAGGALINELGAEEFRHEVSKPKRTESRRRYSEHQPVVWATKFRR